MSLRKNASKWITDAARTEVVKKLMEDQCARNIAVGASAALKGGLQSDAVLRLRIDVHLVAKVAGGELQTHAKYLSFVNSMVPRMFPEVLGIVALDNGRYALLMEDIVNRESGLDLVFRRPTKTKDLVKLTESAFVELEKLHGIPCEKISPELKSITLRDLYAPRLYKKFKEITELDSRLDYLWDLPCEVFGYECPPLKETLGRIESWVDSQLIDVDPTLLHGDPHLGNIFYQAGSSGRVRFIDPNPDAAYGDPIYDFGKLLHWIEPVGWAAYNVGLCRSRIKVDRHRNKVKLSAWLSPEISQAAERRRSQIEKSFYESERFVDKRAQARLALSVAIAHSGLGRLLAQKKQFTACRYVITYLLRALCRWYELVR
jgi:hypothetical protein